MDRIVFAHGLQTVVMPGKELGRPICERSMRTVGAITFGGQFEAYAPASNNKNKVKAMPKAISATFIKNKKH